MHGNTKQLLVHAISLEKTNSIHPFIENFVTIHALPLPGCFPHQFSDEKALLLPTHMKKGLFISSIVWLAPITEKSQFVNKSLKTCGVNYFLT